LYNWSIDSGWWIIHQIFVAGGGSESFSLQIVFAGEWHTEKWFGGIQLEFKLIN